MKQYNPHDKAKKINFWLTEQENDSLMDLVNDLQRKGRISKGHVLRSMVMHCLNNEFEIIKEYSGIFAEIDRAISQLGDGKVFEYQAYQTAKNCEKHIRNKYPQLFVSVRKQVGKAYKTRDALKKEAIYKVIVMERE